MGRIISGTSVLDARVSPLTRAVTGVGVGANDFARPIREMVLSGGITPSNPLVAIGDSHTDNTTSAHFLWDRLKNARTQPGEGMEGVSSSAIVPMGNNGQTLADYLGGNGTNKFSEAMALAPSVVVACWLTNDVRQGGLGLTTAAIRANGAALLNQLVANIKAARPAAKIVLRIPAPYLTINTGANYITDGTTVNPTGLAQIYTDGVRLAHYDVRLAHPDVLIYDPQSRLFGTTSPSALGIYFADQIHQNQAGYEAEADDFANWVNAPAPFNAASAAAAVGSNPYDPWTVYPRAVEDGTRFALVAAAPAVTVTAGNVFLDFGPYAVGQEPSKLSTYDVVHTVGANRAFKIPASSTMSASGSNTRISLGGGGTVPATAAAQTKVRVYRPIQTGDALVNAQLNGSATYKRTGRVVAGGATFMDVGAWSFTTSNAVAAANTWAADLQAGDKIYVEGFGNAPITIGSNFAASGNNTRFTGLAGTDWSLYVGRMVVICRP